MADRPLPAKPCCELEYAFDRLHSAKLEQAFAILVPNRERRVDEPTAPRGALNEDSRHLRPRLLGPAERGEDHSQPDGGTEGVCPPRRIPGAG